MRPQRNPHRPSPCLILAWLWILLVPGVAGALESEAHVKTRLQSVQQQVRETRKALALAQNRAGQLESKLAEVESRIGRVSVALEQTTQTLAGLRQQQDRLKRRRQKLIRQLAQERRTLGGLLRAAYASGRQERLKLLLNQEDPSSLGRGLVYYRYLNQARSEHIRRFQQALETLDGLARETEVNAQALSHTAQTLEREKEELESMRQARRETLAALNREIRANSQTLERLHGDERQLQALLESIRAVLAEIPAQGRDRRPFRSLKGRLPWPAVGKVDNRFGRSRSGAEGKLTWNGAFIRANTQPTVHAISHGRVVFADWMRGYGLLVIIDHGGGYMSLYGHNQSLYKAAGDWVDAGELIARVGDSGGQDVPGLYFEIRRRGKPVNPARWCSRKVKLADSVK
jgi:septal ring factor EnvC (AmiA/AmiB activator)